MSRRTLGLAVLTLPMLGCAPRPEESTSSPSPGACVELSTHAFATPGLCGSEPPIDFSLQPQPYHRLRVRDSAVAAVYRNALVEWTGDGAVSRLLGKAATIRPAFDWRGVAVTQRCDGGVVAWRDGCERGELALHERVGDETFQDLAGGVVDLCLSADGETLYSLGGDGRLRVSRLTGEPVADVEVAAGRTVSGLASSPDGDLLCTWGKDGDVELFEAADLRAAGAFRLPGIRWSLTFAPDAVAAITHPDTVTLLSLTGQTREVKVPSKYLTAIASDGGDRLCVAGTDGIWLIEGSSEPERLADGNAAVDMAFSSDGATVYTLHGTDGIHRFDAASGESLGAFANPEDAQ